MKRAPRPLPVAAVRGAAVVAEVLTATVTGHEVGAVGAAETPKAAGSRPRTIATVHASRANRAGNTQHLFLCDRLLAVPARLFSVTLQACFFAEQSCPISLPDSLPNPGRVRTRTI
jgi:hypothetical protein